MKGRDFRFVSCVLAVLAVASAYGQAIKVVVNGEAIAFGNVGPRTIYGHVMVPFRGVLEHLGATVKWDDATKVIIAAKGSTEIKVLVGTAVAEINGDKVEMDVSSRMVNGVAVVPLRFLSEALGADVRWISKTQTVQIDTDTDVVDNTPVVPKSTPLPPAATGAFVSNQSGFIGASIPLKFTLRAPTGGSATFRIPGASDDLQMVEESEGVYSVLWATPSGKAGALNLNNAAPIASLRNGDTVTYSQLTNKISIDTAPPAMLGFTPEPNARLAGTRPYVSVNFDDGPGSGVDPSSVQISFDGLDVTSKANVTLRGATFRPEVPLDSGVHEVSVVASDRAGNIATSNWAFSVIEASENIRGFAYNGPQIIEAGAQITVLLVAQSGGAAEFSIGNRRVSIPLTESNGGQFAGTYTAGVADDFANEIIFARFKNEAGEIYTAQAGDRISTKAAIPQAPKITAPTATSSVVSPIYVDGTATPFARVRVRIDFSFTPEGGTKLSGPVVEAIVIADQT